MNTRTTTRENDTPAHGAGAHERIVVLIATSQGRTTTLLSRALPSVLRQQGIDRGLVRILIVDDNEDPAALDQIAFGTQRLRVEEGLASGELACALVRNRRTRGRSGTGAWNTGLELLSAEAEPPRWLAILDDDDEYLPFHLARCMRAACAPGVVAAFERLEWVRGARVDPRPFSAADLTPEAFFVGNPGVQGSNLFVECEALRAIGGFDESLHSATDRDLLIRLLRYTQETSQRVIALGSTGVRYHDHDGPRVNTDRVRKHAGLDRFYEKHASAFDERLLRASLDRANRLFGYESSR